MDPSKWSTLRKISLGILALLVIFMMLVPSLVKRYIINNSEELIGRKTEINSIKYNYFTSVIKVYDFKLFEKNDTQVFTSLDTLIVNLEPLKLLSNTLEIEEFYLQGFTTKAIMKNSEFNFDDLVALANDKEQDTTIRTNSEPFKYNFSNIEVKDSKFTFDDQNINRETSIDDISFTIPNISWNQEEKSNADIQFNFENGGYFESTVKINPVNGEFNTTINLLNLALQPFYDYVAQYAEISDFSGSLNADVSINGNTNDVLKSIISGNIDIQEFQMRDTNNKKFLGAEQIHTDLKIIDYFNGNYELNSLNINNSYTYFELDSVSNNFSKIFKLDESEATNVTTDSLEQQTEKSIQYAINELKLTDGTLDYTDNLTGQPFNYNLSSIEIDSDSITSTSKWIDIYATMLLNNRGTLKSDLGIDPNNLMSSTLNFDIQNFLLEDINIYTNYYTGHRILKGDMYYFSKSKLTNGEIDSQNKLIVKNASLENSKGGLYDLPLKFAFFLLTDKNGDVELDIPVRGDLKDPNTDIGPIVWKTFKNVIGKTVAAPVNFLVGLVGGDPKELEEINFTFVDTTLNQKHKRQLSKLIDLEKRKDSLKITMTYYADSLFFKEALAMESIGEKYSQETGKDYLKNESDFTKFVLNRVENDSLNFNQGIQALTIDEPIDSLFVERKEAIIALVKDYIKEEYPISNITVIEANPNDPQNSGSYPKFLLGYGLLEEDKTDNNSD